MAHVVPLLDVPSNYRDSKSSKPKPDLSQSTTIYVGNLSFYTTEEQIYEAFAKCASSEEGGGLKRIIMGLDRNQRTPCGFCFVEFYTHAEALASLRYVSGTKLDERIIRCDLDAGYAKDREYGRGKSGGQVRDEHRTDYDAGRGGWGAQAQKEEAARRALYSDSMNVHGAVAGGGVGWEDRGHTSGGKREREEDDDDEVDEMGRTRRMRLESEQTRS